MGLTKLNSHSMKFNWYIAQILLKFPPSINWKYWYINFFLRERFRESIEINQIISVSSQLFPALLQLINPKLIQKKLRWWRQELYRIRLYQSYINLQCTLCQYLMCWNYLVYQSTKALDNIQYVILKSKIFKCWQKYRMI